MTPKPPCALSRLGPKQIALPWQPYTVAFQTASKMAGALVTWPAR